MEELVEMVANCFWRLRRVGRWEKGEIAERLAFFGGFAGVSLEAAE